VFWFKLPAAEQAFLKFWASMSTAISDLG